MINDILGIHHITSIASDPIKNNHFFTKVLGLRRVKKTVNFDKPSVYHLYFSDPVGTPGTVITYFPFPSRARGHRGIGEVALARFAVLPNSLDFWEDRLTTHGVSKLKRAKRFSTSCLEFTGPDGENLGICEQDTVGLPPADKHIPSEFAICGFHSAQLCVDKYSNIGNLLSLMGFVAGPRDGDFQRFQMPSSPPASIIDVQYMEHGATAQESAGSVHHIAFAVEDDAAQTRVRQALIERGHKVTAVKDRSYFKAIYFRTEDGILFEVATNFPGFATDEPIETMGNALCLPDQHEGLRETLEKQLIPLCVE